MPPVFLPTTPTTSNIVKPFTYTAQDLTAPQNWFRTARGAIQGDILVVRIYTSRAEGVKIGEVRVWAMMTESWFPTPPNVFMTI